MEEDSIYDWDELNDGRGWQASKYSHHHHHAPRAHNPTPHRNGVTQDRLNAPQPATPGAKPNAVRSSIPQVPPNQAGVSGKPPRPVNGAISPTHDEPEAFGSMQAQYPYASNANLSTAARPSMTVSNSNPLQTNPEGGRVVPNGTHNEHNEHPNQEDPPNLARRIIKAFCCG